MMLQLPAVQFRALRKRDTLVSVISRFYGILIVMYFNDHNGQPNLLKTGSACTRLNWKAIGSGQELASL